MAFSSQADLTNFYPADIYNDKFRHIRIIVKEQGMIAGKKEDLVAGVTKRLNQIKKAYDEGRASETKPSSADKQAGLKERVEALVDAKTIYGIALPLPNELSDEQSHQWTAEQGLVKKTYDGVVGSGVLSKILGAGGELATKSGGRQPLIDPGYFQDYKGTEPRTFNFEWDLVANNAGEAEHIRDILYNLKKFSLPKSNVSGISLMSPYMFTLEVENEYINNLMNMNNLVCTSMTVNYSADGSLQMFANGMPKHIKLSMSFAERTTVTADYY